MPLTFSSEDLSLCVLLHVRGEVDLGTAQDLRDLLDHHLNQRHNVIVDLSEVTYFDMSGVHVLEQLGRIFRERNHFLVVVSISPTVQLVFDIIRFDEVPVARTKDEALDLLRGTDARG